MAHGQAPPDYSDKLSIKRPEISPGSPQLDHLVLLPGEGAARTRLLRNKATYAGDSGVERRLKALYLAVSLAEGNIEMPTVVSAGVPIHYEVIGTGTPILLVHGLLSSFEANWVQTGWVNFLLAQGRQVVGMDCRGHGLSGKPHDPSGYGGDHMADDVIAVMDALGLDRSDLMGYSMGGGIAVDLLARMPERFTSVVAGGAGVRTVRKDPTATAEALEADDLSTIADPGALMMRRLAESRSTDPTSLSGRDNDLKALAAVLRGSRGLWGRMAFDTANFTDALRRVQIPVLAVVGDKDSNLAEAQLLIETVPLGELVVLPGEDHLSAVTSQKYKEAVASFLKAHALSTA